VAIKMLAHHLAQAGDLRVERGDDPHLARDDAGVRATDGGCRSAGARRTSCNATALAST